ncbi:hypothetical protein LTR56_008936 [Elasticomyces elasticus]|nr:hypothetical protein LTR56_008936 [Elasticomyces elasticus]KAK3663166.1 hypothetical protein LTR22_006075 [Elasticomyces elasticus]KAK4924063.1 hypothetical protein LTR49_008803 [Elasticomyces elasticus]KAK5764421.1 hypothetical protein LTS12_005397 [Elasticomyces elasticus]
MADPQPSQPDNNNNNDPFATLLNLEDQYHTEGYNLGFTDGSLAGRIEGRLFGLEKGFTKFTEMGRMNGRAAIWTARLPPTQTQGSNVVVNLLQPLSGSDRLKKHITRLTELTDPDSLETKNTEDAVDECEERLAGARSKFTLIARIVGEDDAARSSAAEVEVKRPGKGKGNGEMEDFVGVLPALNKRKPKAEAMEAAEIVAD